LIFIDFFHILILELVIWKYSSMHSWDHESLWATSHELWAFYAPDHGLDQGVLCEEITFSIFRFQYYTTDFWLTYFTYWIITKWTLRGSNLRLTFLYREALCSSLAPLITWYWHKGILFSEAWTWLDML
jgi:hypothetical protein